MTRARPTCHFAPKTGWMNDPNGLVFFNGEYHLFYQYHPFSMVWGPMHWGHAVSTDLLNWEHLPVALKPDELGTCFSGSAVVDWQNHSGLFPNGPGLVAIYTSHKEVAGFDLGYLQQQCLAYSEDAGRSWKKFEANPVLPSIGQSDFRDPKVFWHAASDHWVQVLAVGQEIHIYRSKNLTDWEFCSRFGEGEGAHTEGAWECPDLFELTVEGSNHAAWVLLVGVGPGETEFGSFTQYFVGQFDGKAFHNANPSKTSLLMDEGRDFYAVQSWSDTRDSSRKVIGWMNNWRYANEVPAEGYRGTMSLPRSLALRETPDGMRLVQAFCLPAVEEIDFEPTGWLTDWSAEGEIGSRQGRLKLVLSEDAIVNFNFFGAGVDIRLQRRGDGLAAEICRKIETNNPDFDARFSHQYLVALPFEAAIDLEWVTDKGTLELIFARGEVAISQISASLNSGAPVRLSASTGEFRLLYFNEGIIRI